VNPFCGLARARILRENSRMHRLSIVCVLAIAACGGSSKTTTTTPTPPEGSGSAAATGSAGGNAETEAVVGPPQVAWKDMTKEQRGKYMAKVVMPKMKPLFQSFDPKGFAKFECETCHGGGAKDHSFKMPNPDIFVLPNPETKGAFEALAKDKGDWMKFMATQVKPQMAELLGLPQWEPQNPDPNAFGCFQCHTHK
jgi:hypothetical protein